LREGAQWEKFLKWNNRNRLFDDDDVPLFGDGDEIPSREVIQYFQWCQLGCGTRSRTRPRNTRQTGRFRRAESATAFRFGDARRRGDSYPTITERTMGDAQSAIRFARDALRDGQSVGQVWARLRKWISTRCGWDREFPLGSRDDLGGRTIPWFIQCNPGRYQYFFETTKVEDLRITQPVAKSDPDKLKDLTS
jgi:hypothetical protein